MALGNSTFGTALSQTLDSFLGGRIKLIQPSEGYRAGIDPIFLSASLAINPDETVLDVGTGIGAAAFALAVRCPHAKITGIEIQPELVQLGLQNIEANNLSNCVDILEGDILASPSLFPPHSFDHVMTNPPYYEHTRSQPSPIPGKAQANTETVALGLWLKCCLTMLKAKGTFTMIHRAERLPDILSHLDSQLGNIVVCPLWSGPNKPAKRVIIQGQKNTGTEWRLVSGIMLHGGTEKYTPEAEAILRHAQALVF